MDYVLASDKWGFLTNILIASLSTSNQTLSTLGIINDQNMNDISLSRSYEVPEADILTVFTRKIKRMTSLVLFPVICSKSY